MPRTNTSNILAGLRDAGYTDTDILEYLLFNQLSGAEAENGMRSAQEEFMPDSIDEDGYNHLTRGK